MKLNEKLAVIGTNLNPISFEHCSTLVSRDFGLLIAQSAPNTASLEIPFRIIPGLLNKTSWFQFPFKFENSRRTQQAIKIFGNVSKSITFFYVKLCIFLWSSVEMLQVIQLIVFSPYKNLDLASILISAVKVKRIQKIFRIIAFPFYKFYKYLRMLSCCSVFSNLHVYGKIPFQQFHRF